MDQFDYRMNNRVSDRLRDSLKKQLMTTVLSDSYFYLDREDFVQAFQDLINELNGKQKGDV